MKQQDKLMWFLAITVLVAVLAWWLTLAIECAKKDGILIRSTCVKKDAII